MQNPDFLGAGCPLTPHFRGCGLMRGPESFTTDAPLGLVTPERPEVDPQSPMDGDTDRYTPLRPGGSWGEGKSEVAVLAAQVGSLHAYSWEGNTCQMFLPALCPWLGLRGRNSETWETTAGNSGKHRWG